MRLSPLVASCFAALLASPLAFAADPHGAEKSTDSPSAALSASASAPPPPSAPSSSSAAAPSAPPAPADDEGPDEVVLKDGTSLRGKVLRQQPGTAVVIRMSTGRIRTIAWDDVKSVDASVAPAPPPPAAPTFSVSASERPTADRVETTGSDQAASAPIIGEIGFRTGYGLATGDLAQGSALTTTVNGVIPAIVDAGVRPVPWFYLGGFFQYGVLSMANCGTDVTDCSGSDVRLGVQLRLHANAQGNVDPWFAYGVGYEWLNLSAKGTSNGAPASVDAQYKGWTPVELLAGVDIRVSDTFVLAPYGGLTLGTYDSGSATVSVNGASQSASADINSTSSHIWISLGLRGAFAIGGEYARADGATR